MRKSFKALIAAIFVAVSVPASVSAFEWSECWCNYGGGIEKGDFILNVDGGLWFSDSAYWGLDGYWFIPPVMVELQYAQPIWKLPFTFGGYAGLHAFGYNYDTVEDGKIVKKSTSYWGLFFGGEAAYHVMLPPEGLDVYAVTRVGGAVPFIRPEHAWVADYFHVGGALGASWYFGDTFGLNLEFGYPMAKFGISLKF